MAFIKYRNTQIPHYLMLLYLTFLAFRCIPPVVFLTIEFLAMNSRYKIVPLRRGSSRLMNFLSCQQLSEVNKLRHGRLGSAWPSGRLTASNRASERYTDACDIWVIDANMKATSFFQTAKLKEKHLT